MPRRTLTGLTALLFGAVLWSGSANAYCWWTGTTWACLYPADNQVYYAPPYPFGDQGVTYAPSFYPYTNRYPGPKLNGG